MLQQEPYPHYSTWGEAVGTYFPKAHNKIETNSRDYGGRPDILEGNPPGRI